MEGTTLLETAPKNVTPAAPESNVGKWMGTDGRAAWMDVRWLRDGAVPCNRRPSARRSAGTLDPPEKATQWFGAIIAVFLVARQPAACLRLARRSHRACPRDGAEHLHVCDLYRPVRICHEAWHIAALRFIASLAWRRMVAGVGATSRSLAEQIARADCRAHWRGREPRISHGGCSASDCTGSSAASKRSCSASGCRRRWWSGCSRTPDGVF